MQDDIELVIFDFDGTLIEFHHTYLISEAERIIELLKHPVVHRDELHAGFCAFDFFRFVDALQREMFIEHFWNHFDWNNFPKAKILPGVAAALEAFRARGAMLSVATARICPETDIRTELSNIGIDGHISHVRTRPGEETHWTDKRDTILSVCEAAGVAPQRAVMVGDIPTDITSAKDVGIGAAVAVLSGGITRSVLEGANPDYLIGSVAELPSVLFRGK